MFISGLWHGANWTFIAWGLFHAFFLITERINQRQPIYQKAPIYAKIFLTQIIVVFSWVLFRAPDLSQAMSYYGSMLGLNQPAISHALLSPQIFSPYSTFFMILAFILVLQPYQAHELSVRITPLKLFIGISIFVISLLALFTQTFNPFLYFQF